MPQQVCHGALLRCSCGAAPSSLVVLPLRRVMSSKLPVANIMDHQPMLNIQPFGLCRSPANPAVAAASAAAMGVLTPMPCIPNTPSPWLAQGSTVLAGGQPALNDSARLACTWAGVIEVSQAGQVTHRIP